MADRQQYADDYEQSYVLYQRGRDAMSAGDLEAAIRAFEDSVSIAPHFKTLELLGECFLKRGEYMKSLLPLAASAGLGTKAYRSLFLLAQALEAVGERRRAIDKLTQALEFKADFKAARQLLDSLRTPSQNDNCS